MDGPSSHCVPILICESSHCYPPHPAFIQSSTQCLCAGTLDTVIVLVQCCICSAPPLFPVLFARLFHDSPHPRGHQARILGRNCVGQILEVRRARPQCRRRLSCPPTACPCPTSWRQAPCCTGALSLFVSRPSLCQPSIVQPSVNTRDEGNTRAHQLLRTPPSPSPTSPCTASSLS